jgi:hypothetical protein
MNIGLFGDSYIDLIWHRHPDHTPHPQDVPWSGRLLKALDSPVISSGLGGSNQYYAIKTWQDCAVPLDVAIFTFTWPERMYSDLDNFQEILSSHAERRKPNITDTNAADIMQGMDLYYRYLRSPGQEMFNYEQQVKWCLELPKYNEQTKFIFLPNTEVARDIALRHYRGHGGVLVDFAFETLSNREPGAPGAMPIWCGRYGHLNDRNHELVKDMVKDIIDNYDQYRDESFGIYKLDYQDFDTI